MADNEPTPAPLAADQPAPAAVPTQPIVIQQQAAPLGCLGKLLVLVTLCVMVMVLIGMVARYFDLEEGPREKYHSLSRDATKKVAIIDVSGAILDGDDFVKKQIDRVREDKDIVAIVLRINSPGGTVTGADYIYHHLRKLAEERELPLVVSMGSVCASGGYYIAMAVGDQHEAIFAEPTTWTGSIGVIIPHFDLSGLLGRFNVKDDSITSGPLKEMGSPTRPMSDEERKLLQALVDECFAGFKEIVVAGRPKFKDDPQALDAVTTGQIFTAKQALERGLVDKLGFIEDAIDRAAELSGVDKDNLQCIEYKEPKALVDELLGVRAVPSREGRPDLSVWLDLAAPRAYYLWTWMPTILTNTQP